MVETLHPGIYIIEEPGQPVVAGVGVSEYGMFGVTERGPDDVSPIITSFSQFARIYGSFYQGNYAPYDSKAFFDNGGGRFRMFRTLEPGLEGALQTGSAISNNGIDWASAYPGGIYLRLVNAGASRPLLLRFSGTEMIIELATDAGTKSTLNTGTPATDQITWTANLAGVAGDSITITLVDPAAALVPLSIAVVGTAITVTLETNAGSNPISTAPEVVDAINTITNGAYSAAAAALVTAATSDAGVVIAAGSAPLASGVDPAITSSANDVVTLVQANEWASLFMTAAHTATSTGVGLMVAVASTLLTGSAGAVQARAPVTDLAGLQTTFLEALYKGAYGNGLSYSTVRAWTLSSAALSNGDTEITVIDVTSFKLGDLIHITDGTTSVVCFVTSISVTDRKLGFRAVVPGTPIASGAYVRTASSNHLSTKTTAALSDGDISVTLSSARPCSVGQRVIFDDGTTSVEVIISSINGNTIRFDAVTLATPIASGAVAASVEFMVKIIENETIQEAHYNLSMELNSPDYYVDRLYGDTIESEYITAPGAVAMSAGFWKYPTPTVADIFFRFGDDGAAVTSTDVIGADVVPRTGIYRLRDYPSVNFIAAPGFTAVAVQNALIALCENLGDTMCILSCPLADDKPDEAVEFRNVQLNADTHRAALYYPWLKVPDPDNVEFLMDLPHDGFMAGIWARVATERGIFKAPGNEVVNNVQGVTYNISDGEHDILNPIGVNATIVRAGRGIRIMGARTLQSVTDDLTYIGTRRVLDFIRRSLKQAMTFAIFEPNDSDLWARVQDAVSEFLYDLWSTGALVPRDDSGSAFYVKCDAETNPRSKQLRGEVHCEVGVAVSLPGEFVVFHLRRIAGEGVVEEV